MVEWYEWKEGKEYEQHTEKTEGRSTTVCQPKHGSNCINEVDICQRQKETESVERGVRVQKSIKTVSRILLIQIRKSTV